MVRGSNLLASICVQPPRSCIACTVVRLRLPQRLSAVELISRVLDDERVWILYVRGDAKPGRQRLAVFLEQLLLRRFDARMPRIAASLASRRISKDHRARFVIGDEEHDIREWQHLRRVERITGGMRRFALAIENADQGEQAGVRMLGQRHHRYGGDCIR